MYTHTPTIFNHMLWFIQKDSFAQLVGHHQTDRYAKVFSTREEFLSLLVAQIRWSDSIRDLQTDLWLHNTKWYHIWLSSFCRSTFSYWLNKTNPIVFQTLFYHLLQKTQKLSPHIWDSKNRIYAIDSTIITWTLSVFDRAKYRTKKWGLKLHTRLDYNSWLPDLIIMSDGKRSDWKACYDMIDDIESWSILLFDRWYLDYSLLRKVHEKWITFVTRTKKTTQYCPVRSIAIVDVGIQYDCIAEFLYEDAREKYPEQIRIVRYLHKETWKLYEFITNNFDLPAIKIAELYRKRREIETLFRWLKQNLVIKEFLWTSQNAVENQIRVALIYYLVVNYIRLKTKTKENLLTLTRKISYFLFERAHLLDILWVSVAIVKKAIAPPMQWLFDSS